MRIRAIHPRWSYLLHLEYHSTTTLESVRWTLWEWFALKHHYTLNIKISSFYIKFDTVYIKNLRNLKPITSMLSLSNILATLNEERTATNDYFIILRCRRFLI
uniref:AlNc14C130G6930 protein n=1 Tax=Albugo laibachii Nc14 TaxID=890382 RepID=F0WK78_9STRA|nr:AlNc14C130G6930 [Albugo laibachii Nc14]|eukprot:CCA21681.1 AlNc14C130G6930 [Albugo laibachii Nc14]